MARPLEFAGPGLRAWVRCEQGSRRRLEDAWVVCMQARLGRRSGSLFGVFDGLGGEPNGDVASRVARERAEHAVADSRTLLDGLRSLNAHVLATGGATTAVLAFISDDGEVDLAYAGDSLAIMLVDGKPCPITEPDRTSNGLLRDFLGNPGLQGRTTKSRLPQGSTLLLGSDGVDGVVGLSSLGPLLRAPWQGVSREIDAVFQAIRDRGAPDNATLIAVRRA